MNDNSVLTKTQKGFEEINLRTHKLPAKLRAALIMVDGAKTVGEHLRALGGQSDAVLAHLKALLEGGFVEDRSAATTQPLAAVEVASQPVPAAAQVAPQTPPPAPVANRAPEPVDNSQASFAVDTQSIFAFTMRVRSPGEIKARLGMILQAAMDDHWSALKPAFDTCRTRDDLRDFAATAKGFVRDLRGHEQAERFWRKSELLFSAPQG